MPREYLSVAELLEVLARRELAIDDQNEANFYLQLVGHYRLSDYYPAFYDANSVGEDRRFADHSSSEVFKLYYFDRRLRVFLWGPLEKMEIALRSLIVMEIGDFLKRQAPGQPAFIKLFDKQFYHIQQQDLLNRFNKTKNRCVDSAAFRYGETIGVDLKRFRYLEPKQKALLILPKLDAWQVMQAAYLRDLAAIYVLLRQEIKDAVASHFALPSDVLGNILEALRLLRNACAHHMPIWNWDQGRGAKLTFPRRYSRSAAVTESNQQKIYGYCAVLHILLATLSAGSSTWFERLKLLIGELEARFRSQMGFPDDWSTLNFWNTTDVRKLALEPA